jgi:precorrin-4/cobalt-precorrin-4 C11-methyltransferase
MKVKFVGAGPGDPDLLTVKAYRLLTEADCCIYAGSLVSPAVVALLPADCERHDSAGMTLDEVIAVIVDAAARGLDVIRLHTGEPALYGAIAEQMERLDALRIVYQVVPGISAFQAAAATLQVELTVPEVSQTVVIGRVAGRTPVPETESLSRLAALRATLCLYLSVHKMAEIAATLAEAYGADCPVAVVCRASWPDEQVVEGSLADIAERVAAAGITKIAVVLVGPALRSRGTRSKLYDAHFSHGRREASEA